ncbi:hypothetical protein GGX14DRAFT_667705 [Mycena pura]|uniref:Uncharacterized protein n=1 Tax=Mycena pura TaxID=153505 RepID=A0AAD6Y9B8_9AGAR|nr:hypothetical protein GGX14DRAFT_667705 [Mycena pura]
MAPSLQVQTDLHFGRAPRCWIDHVGCLCPLVLPQQYASRGDTRAVRVAAACTCTSTCASTTTTTTTTRRTDLAHTRLVARHIITIERRAAAKRALRARTIEMVKQGTVTRREACVGENSGSADAKAKEHRRRVREVQHRIRGCLCELRLVDDEVGVVGGTLGDEDDDERREAEMLYPRGHYVRRTSFVSEPLCASDVIPARTLCAPRKFCFRLDFSSEQLAAMAPVVHPRRLGTGSAAGTSSCMSAAWRRRCKGSRARATPPASAQRAHNEGQCAAARARALPWKPHSMDAPARPDALLPFEVEHPAQQPQGCRCTRSASAPVRIVKQVLKKIQSGGGG